MSNIRYLDVMEALLPYASDGIQGVPDAVDLLHRAAAGGFVTLTDKLIPINGILCLPQIFGIVFIYSF